MNNQSAYALFVTGTDTGVGKTLVACALLRRFERRGLVAIGMKPVAAGLDEGGRNDDVEALRGASSPALAAQIEPRQINPYALRQPIAPHLAAIVEGIEIRFPNILSAYNALRQRSDAMVVEGVGGFRVPLGPDGDSADLAGILGLPIILVVGLRLGCINHALLTAEAITARGLHLAGWVANGIDPRMAASDANIETLRQQLASPLLGILPFMAEADSERAADLLRLPDEIAA